MPRPRIGSLCSGAGGLDLAVECVTCGQTIWHAEYDDDASKVLSTRWPGIPNHRDITATDWTGVEPIDIVTAGYPCQPFSAAGQRKGTDDERHLWPYVAEAIRVLRPRLVVLENVAGHRSLGFDCVLADLAGMRYDAQWCSLRASDVGAPHRRERLFVVAHPAGDRWDQGRSESAGFLGRSDAAFGGDEDNGVDLLPTPSVADGMGGHLARSGARGDELLLPGVAKAYAEGALLPTPSAADGNGGGRYNSGGHQSTLPGTVRDLLPTPRRSDGDGGPNPLARAERMDDVETRVIRLGGKWGKYATAIDRWERLTRSAPEPTELSRNGKPRLAPAFSEWMMGWPAGWVTDVDVSRNAQLRIIGNGVVPQQAVAALRWLFSIQAVTA
ncbi:DNA cytosine methyltransferase [Mycobacteroides abscessus]|uniref:DNA cytosine methyltransferase n=1 Tax=Mycobacteroides abscessus TaxID=36809 RepID=UPI00188E783A|nr:DNA cytosine methyltransferase [Mycobacteroides abscessus]